VINQSVTTALMFELFCVGVVVGEDWGLNSRHSTSWATAPVHLAMANLEMKSCQLFVRAGLEMRSSQSQLPN
jgi:hypothetical protein